jgi:hypothetical protein
VFEYLQEVQVKTVGIPAEYGGALGGVISAVTKSGGNVFHGEGHYYYLGSGLSAGPVKRLVLSPVDEISVGNFQEPKQPDHNNEVGGSLGGPIVHDRLFFFGSLSPRFRRTTNTYLFNNGAETGDIERDQTILNAYGKVNYASRRANAYFGALLTPTTSTGTLPAYTGFGSRYLPSTQDQQRCEPGARLRDSPAKLHRQRRSEPDELVLPDAAGGSLLRQLQGHGRPEHDTGSLPRQLDRVGGSCRRICRAR